jgi:hypothetical protein
MTLNSHPRCAAGPSFRPGVDFAQRGSAAKACEHSRFLAQQNQISGVQERAAAAQGMTVVMGGLSCRRAGLCSREIL